MRLLRDSRDDWVPPQIPGRLGTSNYLNVLGFLLVGCLLKVTIGDCFCKPQSLELGLEDFSRVCLWRTQDRKERYWRNEMEDL